LRPRSAFVSVYSIYAALNAKDSLECPQDNCRPTNHNFAPAGFTIDHNQLSPTTVSGRLSSCWSIDPVPSELILWLSRFAFLSLALAARSALDTPSRIGDFIAAFAFSAVSVEEKSFHFLQPSKSMSACIHPHSLTLRSSQTKLTGCMMLAYLVALA